MFPISNERSIWLTYQGLYCNCSYERGACVTFSPQRGPWEDEAMSVAAAYPLAGLRVIDLSTEIAGPYCTKLLADAGADVIKVESPGGDPLRRWTASGATVPNGEDSAFFQHLNASKRGLVFDIETAAGREALLALATTADIVVESFAPATLDRLGLGFNGLRIQNPALSLVSISPWGGSGPWADRPATEFTLQAAMGSTAYRGLPDGMPVAAAGRLGEWLAGSYAAVGALVAWLSARNTGSGHHVDVSMFESMLMGMTAFSDLRGQWREGPLIRSIDIPSIEPAKDGWVGLCTITSQQWKDFCLLIGHPELGESARYLQLHHRMQDLPFMQRIIHGWTRQHTVEEIIEFATQLRIPVGPIGNGQTLPHMDHFVARGVFGRGPGGFLRPRPPYQFEKARLRPFGPAPRLGAHTAVVREQHAQTRFGAVPAEPGPALPLTGLRVIDLTNFWAGPMAPMHLAMFGADVVKVESIQRPDAMRFADLIPNDPVWEWSAVFAGANVGKRDITLDLTAPEGLALLKRLLANADVVIDNFSARVLDHFGLTWEGVHWLNPRIIMVRMPAFGLDGPWRDHPGFGQTVEQISGLGWITGYEDRPLVPRAVCDPLAGLHAVLATLLALEHRRRTGEGQLVEVPLIETALNVAADQVIEYSAYGKLVQRQGNRGPGAAPQGVYRCAEPDEYVAIAVATDTHWQALRHVMGDPEWARDPALATAAGRRAAHDMIDTRLERWLSTQGRDAAAQQLVDAGVPAHGVINAHFVMPNPQLEHRCFFQVLRHPVTGETRYPGLPMAVSGLERQLHRRPPPTLGQHNEEILGGELGLSAAEIADLRQRQIIGERPRFM
jgi:crotonobetainyl-CoA:carnitine CoA-transferase CaiB-like acyl-CoA transferase